MTQMMRIEGISVEEFASGEHRGLEVDSIDGDSLLLRGGSRTGKTLTFNAIIYNLLGAQETIDLATGRQNEVEIEFTDGKKFFRGNPEAEYDNGEEEFSGSEASEKFDADVYVNMGNTELVVEVAMGDNPREIEHVQQHLEKGFDAVWVAARNQEVLEGLKQRIEEEGLDLDRVAFRLVRKFRELGEESL